jgi:hypothetical protein
MWIGAILTVVAAIVGWLFGADGWLGALLVGGAFGLGMYLTARTANEGWKDNVLGVEMVLDAIEGAGGYHEARQNETVRQLMDYWRGQAEHYRAKGHTLERVQEPPSAPPE